MTEFLNLAWNNLLKRFRMPVEQLVISPDVQALLVAVRSGTTTFQKIGHVITTTNGTRANTVENTRRKNATMTLNVLAIICVYAVFVILPSAVSTVSARMASFARRISFASRHLGVNNLR